MKAKALKFSSPTEEPVFVALTTGHTAVVEPGGTMLDPIFHREAIARGCVAEGIPGREHQGAPTPGRRELIKTALQAMISGEDPEDFLPNGMPSKGNLDERLGFKSERHEVESIFAELTTEAEAEESAGDEQEGEGEDEKTTPHVPEKTTKAAAKKPKARAKAAKK